MQNFTSALKNGFTISFIGRFVLLCLLLTWGILSPRAADADVVFVNGYSQPTEITGCVQFWLQPGQSLSFVPSSSATNEIDFANGTVLDLQDGMLYSINPDGSVSSSPVLRSLNEQDSDAEKYFLQGLELFTGIAALYAGWLAVKRGLHLGDVWRD